MSISKVPVQMQSHNEIQNQAQQITPFQVLKVKVYPVINNVILKLIDHIVKSQEVQKHEQRLKKKKLLDQLQRKYIERDIEKQQLGSDYQQSDDEEYYKKLQMKKEDVQQIINKRLDKNRIKTSSQLSAEKQVEELGENVFNPVQFIINELKVYQQFKTEGKLDQWQAKFDKKTAKQNPLNQFTDEPAKVNFTSQMGL